MIITMTATNKKSTRTHNTMRPLGIIRQPHDVLNNERFSIDNYVKKPLPASSSSNTIDTLTSRKSISTNPSIIIAEQQTKPDHTECLESINLLKAELEQSKHENIELNSELCKLSADLSNCQLQIDSVMKENLILKSEKEQLKIENTIVNNNFQNLSNEFIVSRDQWILERDQLEKSLNEIRKELENKIIDLRSKHCQEIELFEEKIRVLKTHLADTLNLRSIERQYEIDRISEELAKSQTNEEHLRIRLNKVMGKLDSNMKGKSQLCDNCMQSVSLNKNKPTKIITKRDSKNGDEICVDRSLKTNDKLKTGAVKSIDH